MLFVGMGVGVRVPMVSNHSCLAKGFEGLGIGALVSIFTFLVFSGEITAIQ